MLRTNVVVFSAEVTSLTAQVKLGEPGAYDQLVAVLTEACRSIAERKRFFPISVVREAYRQHLKQTGGTEAETLLLYKAFADAVLDAMASNDGPEVSRTGRSLRELAHELDQSDTESSLLLRLHYIAGLTLGEISILRPSPGELLRLATASVALQKELSARGLSAEFLKQQNLRPRGDVTTMLEKVRDGERSLGDVVVHEGKNLKRQASYLLQRESGGISLEPEDLVNEMYLRMPKNGLRSPINHMEFEALAKRIMRHVLIDRGRRPLPTQSRFSEELSEDRADVSGDMEDSIMLKRVAQVVDEVIQELFKTHRETAEMLKATLYDDADQKHLAKVYGVSVSTVKRRIKAGRDVIRKRLNLEPSR